MVRRSRRCSHFVGVVGDERATPTKPALGFHQEEIADREMERARKGEREKSEEGVLDAGVCGLPPAT